MSDNGAMGEIMMAKEDQGTAAGSNGDGVEILLVEDNPSYVELTMRALREIAKDVVRVDIASDGERALAMLLSPKAQRLPRLVILDLKLPKLGGLEVLRQLRANPATRYLPVVMLTSSRVPSDVAESYRLGANSFVVRPMNFPTYLRVLGDIINYWLVTNEQPPQAGTP
jgi:two-component system response regulator